MAVDFDAFLRWCEDRFYDVQVSGNEIKVNSIFKKNDQDHKLWCNPYGGKKGIELGCYRCWKTDRRGTLAGLIMEVDGCSFRDALEILGGESSFEDLEQRVEEFWEQESTKDTPKEEVKLELPLCSYLLTSLPTGNPYRYKAEKILSKRKLPIEGLYVCMAGTYKNRIVIPYYDENGKLIYFNCRAMADEYPKYLGPPKELGVGKADVIFMPKWYRGGKLYFTEGEFDAITLSMCDFQSAAIGGKSLSTTQLNILKGFYPVIAGDNDNAGKTALMVIGEALLGYGLKLNYVMPPEGYKDWNAMLEDFNTEVVKGYILKSEKEFTETTIIELTEQFI